MSPEIVYHSPSPLGRLMLRLMRPLCNTLQFVECNDTMVIMIPLFAFFLFSFAVILQSDGVHDN